MNQETKTYGLYLGVASVLVTAIMYALGMFELGGNNIALSVLSLVLMIAAFILAGNALKKRQDGYMTFGEAFKTYLGIGVIASIISTAWMALFVFVLEPDYQQNMRDIQYEKMIEANPDMPEDQIEMALSMAEKFSSPVMILVFGLVGAIIFYLIIGAIMAAITKKNPPIFNN